MKLHVYKFISERVRKWNETSSLQVYLAKRENRDESTGLEVYLLEHESVACLFIRDWEKTRSCMLTFNLLVSVDVFTTCEQFKCW